MDQRDYRSYRELFEVLTSFLPPPDLVVYLQAEVSTLKRRIAKRGRDYEQDISPDYLQRLNQLYAEWIDGISLCPVLTIPTDNLDFVAHNSHLELISNKILEKLQGREVVIFP
jgi:deoxyadenosine/deoxycytidine kinase